MIPNRWKWIAHARAGLALLLIAAAVGCSTFNRDWKAAAAKPIGGGSLEGAWEGTWLSHTNGHSGDLRAIITKDDAGAYRTRFHATYWKIFSGEYTVTLNARRSGDAFLLEGRKDLGTIFLWYRLGEYSYEGKSTDTEFKCTYRSSKDGGVFELTRPK